MLELLRRVLEYADHKHDCPELQVQWNKGPCECGWEEVERELINQGILPPIRKCEHCGRKKEQPEFPTMGVCFHCSLLLCHDCIDDGHGEPGTCDKAPNKVHQRTPPREFPGGPGGSHTTFMPGEGE